MLNKKTWERLNTAQVSDDLGLSVLRLHPESGFDIYAALDVSTAQRIVILKSTVIDLCQGKELPAARGFSLQLVRNSHGPHKGTSLYLRLTKPAFSDVFDVVANDAIGSLLQSRNEPEGFDAFIGRIADWQAFLDRLPNQGLSEPAQMGLFGELWFLGDFLLPCINQDRAVRAWTGPDAASKDFIFNGFAVEIKTTSPRQPVRIQVANELQLDASGLSSLYLFCLLLERATADGMTLPDIVKHVRSQFTSNSVAAAVLAQRLIQAGYLDSDAEHYTTRFALRSQLCYQVGDEFPRIIGGDLRPGVGDVRYSIGLSECDRFGVRVDILKKLIIGDIDKP